LELLFQKVKANLSIVYCVKMGEASRRVKVAIFGGGIGGLTVAHELSKDPKYDITIYEMTDSIGGLARSSRDASGCATEYCWRVFFGFYNNLFKVMGEIKGTCGPLANESYFAEDGVPEESCQLPSTAPELVKFESKSVPKGQSTLSNLILYRNLNVDVPDKTLDRWLRDYHAAFYGFTACDKRLLDADKAALSGVTDDKNTKGTGCPSTWKEALGEEPSAILPEIGPWLGMDKNKGAYLSVIKVGMEMNTIRTLVNGQKNWITSLPTSEALFDPWYMLLVSRGVKFQFQTKLNSITRGSTSSSPSLERSVQKIVLADVIGSDGVATMVRADHYVLSIPIEALNKLTIQQHWDGKRALERGGGTPPIFNKANLQWLVDNSLHHQVSYQVYFDRPILTAPNKSLPGGTNSLLLIGTPWNLIILQYDQAYKREHAAPSLKRPLREGEVDDRSELRTPLCTDLLITSPKLLDGIPSSGLSQGSKGAASPLALAGWSVAVCTSYVPGIVYGKTFDECTYEERLVEMWAQIENSKQLDEVVRANNPFTLAEAKNFIVHWSPEWVDYPSGERPPKFTNNAGGKSLRPSYYPSPIGAPNLYVATAYVQETIDIFSMEAACIGGQLVAKSITASVGSKKGATTDKGTESNRGDDHSSVKDGIDNEFIIPRPPAFAPLRAIDELSYSMGGPNVGPGLLILLLLLFFGAIGYLISRLVKSAKKRNRDRDHHSRSPPFGQARTERIEKPADQLKLLWLPEQPPSSSLKVK
jgi:hypothetical protein